MQDIIKKITRSKKYWYSFIMHCRDLNNLNIHSFRKIKHILLAFIIFYSALASESIAEEDKVFVQENISAAYITREGGDYLLNLHMSATDIEEMFQKTMKERIGVDLMRSGALESQIGSMVLKRISVKDNDSVSCEKNLVKAGEDPTNDELVLIIIKFKCKTDHLTYDARELLSVLGQRAWQVVVFQQEAKSKKYFINLQSDPIGIKTADNK